VSKQVRVCGTTHCGPNGCPYSCHMEARCMNRESPNWPRDARGRRWASPRPRAPNRTKVSAEVRTTERLSRNGPQLVDDPRSKVRVAGRKRQPFGRCFAS
jgi:hypothetical protein